MNWKHWSLIAVLLLLIFPAINMALKSELRQAQQGPPEQPEGTADVITPAEQVASRTDNSTDPSNAADCIRLYVSSGSSVANEEITRGFCATAFDPAAHAVDRARSLCQVRGWSERHTASPIDVSMQCYKENPLPTCPSGLTFQLHNKRCEVFCDSMAGFAPDASGLKCVKTCPDSAMAVYVGYATKCIQKVTG